MHDRLKEFLFPNGKHSWRTQAEKDLRSCFDCAQCYHELLSKSSSFKQKDVFKLTVKRVSETMKNASSSFEFSCVEEELVSWQSQWFELMTAVKETLKYPRLLLDESLHKAFLESLLVALDHDDMEDIEEKLPGVYLLLVHPNNQVCLAKLLSCLCLFSNQNKSL